MPRKEADDNGRPLVRLLVGEGRLAVAGGDYVVELWWPEGEANPTDAPPSSEGRP